MSAPQTATKTEEPTQGGEGYWQVVWRQLKKNVAGMTGMVVAVFLFGLASTAPLLANDRPIIAQYSGNLSFPAFATYVDVWVPWKSMRYQMKSLQIGDTFPMSDHYPELQGQDWKDVAESDEMGFAIWPPVEWHPNQFDPTSLKQAPSDAHWLGTDDLGRDVLSRLIHGTVVAMLVGIIAMSLSSAIGITLGVIAGFFGGWVDITLSRITEVVMCFPSFFLIIAVIAFLEPSIINIMLVLGFVGWTGIFRLIRGEVLLVRNLDYIAAAKSMGMSETRIMFKHVLPNVVSPVLVAVPFGIAGAVLAETSLSFLGFGDPSVPSWGEIVYQGRTYVSQGMWHLTVYPGIAIFVTLTAFNLFGQGLRDAMDPKLRH